MVEPWPIFNFKKGKNTHFGFSKDTREKDEGSYKKFSFMKCIRFLSGFAS